MSKVVVEKEHANLSDNEKSTRANALSVHTTACPMADKSKRGTLGGLFSLLEEAITQLKRILRRIQGIHFPTGAKPKIPIISSRETLFSLLLNTDPSRQMLRDAAASGIKPLKDVIGMLMSFFCLAFFLLCMSR